MSNWDTAMDAIDCYKFQQHGQCLFIVRSSSRCVSAPWTELGWVAYVSFACSRFQHHGQRWRDLNGMMLLFALPWMCHTLHYYEEDAFSFLVLLFFVFIHVLPVDQPHCNHPPSFPLIPPENRHMQCIKARCFPLNEMKARLDPGVTLTPSELCIFKTEKKAKEKHTTSSVITVGW